MEGGSLGSSTGIAAMKRVVYERTAWWCWLLLLVTIPVSSFPLVARFSGGETPVSPLALFPLGGVILLAIIPALLKGRKLPGLLWPLMLFLLFAILSSALSFWLPLIPFKGVSSGSRFVRTLITLIIGLGFYLSAMISTAQQGKLRASLQALYTGLILVLIWSSIQGFFVLKGVDHQPLVITQIHHLFSVRDPLPDRVVGMAFEPSWLGDQLVVLYLPLLLASVARRYSAFDRRLGPVSIELLLALWSAAILLLTKSRISFVSLLVLAGIAYLVMGLRMLRKAQRVPGRRGASLFAVGLRYAAGTLLLAAIALAAVLLVLAGMSKVDSRMENLVSISTRLQDDRYFHPNEGIFAIGDRLAFAERMVYWTVGLRTFSEHPLLGVGLGNAGFFFESNLPAYGYQLTEIRNVFVRQEYGFPNPKNLWVRTLAEGGILGFSSYAAWFLLTGFGAFLAWKQGKGVEEMLGLAGVIAFVTQLVEGFSIDSYALPQSWIMLGIVTAGISRVLLRKREPVVAGKGTA
jgi:O-antigen ligase